MSMRKMSRFDKCNFYPFLRIKSGEVMNIAGQTMMVFAIVTVMIVQFRCLESPPLFFRLCFVFCFQDLI